MAVAQISRVNNDKIDGDRLRQSVNGSC